MLSFQISLFLALFALSSRSLGNPIHNARSSSSSSNTKSSNVTILPVTNIGNQAYTVPVSMNGVELSVQPDLGSSDLVAFSQVQIPNATNLSIAVANTFGQGEAIGFLEHSTAVIGNFTIPDQTFQQYVSEQDFGAPDGINGLLGLGPRFFTVSFFILDGTPFVDLVPDRIFKANPGTPNILTLQYSRILSDDKGAVQTDGHLTFASGTVLDGFEVVQGQPKLPISRDPSSFLHQHWEVLLDKDGITGPDGQPIPAASVFSSSNQLRAFFDSGFTFPAVPDNVAAAIYSRVPGSQLNTSFSYWTIPCDYELNISFSFAGEQYPIHPLDVSVPYDIANQTIGNGTCMGTFQPFNFTASAEIGAGDYDIVMGMPFLRNVYFLLDFGNYTSAADPNGPDAFIQLLSTTNKSMAHQEFVNVRLGGNDTTGSQPALLPSPQAQNGSSI